MPSSRRCPTKLRWLPKVLPAHVWIVVSTLPEEQYRCFPRLRAALTSEAQFVGVPPLDPARDIAAIVDDSLAMEKRTLTPEQRSLVRSSWCRCMVRPCALHLR